jgi:uncharacterized membrane protein
MNDEVINEVQELRKIQNELHAKLDQVNQKIDELAANIAKNRKFILEEITPALASQMDVDKQEVQSQSTLQNIEIISQEHKRDIASTSKSLELKFGRIWLVRIGVVLLLTGLVFLGNFAWNEFIIKFGPLEKLLLIYLSGFLLGGIGWILQYKNKSLRAYSLVLVGAGIATIYYATYAAHFVSSLSIIKSSLLAGSLLVALSVSIVVLAAFINCEVIASIITILGFYTTSINPLGSFSLFSNIILSLAAIFFLLRKNGLRFRLLV